MKNIHVEPADNSSQESRKAHVLTAVTVVVVLAVLLGARLAGMGETQRESQLGPRSVAVPPDSRVPQSQDLEVSKLSFPCWSCRDSREWPIEFKTDLDLMAPLGTGKTNAALWFKDFTKPIGIRYPEVVEAMKRRIKTPGSSDQVFPPDDPLLLEAEPWCNQAVMKFYPDIFELMGPETRIPNLLFQLSLAKSWTARGLSNPDSESAMEDCRRAIRLGRLLRQEDVTIIADLVGLACIRIGTEGVYELAVREGDTEQALLASVILSEVAPQRLLTSEKINTLMINDYITRLPSGELKVEVPDRVVEALLKFPETCTHRRFLGEAMMSMNLLKYRGTREQQELVSNALKPLMRHGDPTIAAMFRWAYEIEPSESYIQENFLNYPVNP